MCNLYATSHTIYVPSLTSAALPNVSQDRLRLHAHRSLPMACSLCSGTETSRSGVCPNLYHFSLQVFHGAFAADTSASRTAFCSDVLMTPPSALTRQSWTCLRPCPRILCSGPAAQPPEAPDLRGHALAHPTGHHRSALQGALLHSPVLG